MSSFLPAWLAGILRYANLLILMKSNLFDFQIDQSVLSPMPRVGQNCGTRKHLRVSKAILNAAYLIGVSYGTNEFLELYLLE